MSSTQTHSFQAEVSELLDLMIHSLYSNKEIFLRELVSNSSDAIDKLRFEKITKPNLVTEEGKIQISVDTENKTITVEDFGIGMSQEELVQNLGTIAHSGTKKYLSHLKEEDKKNSSLIGQFGVGFYAAFMVANKVSVESKSALGGESTVWESEGKGSYTLSPGSRTTNGTKITMYLREGESEFAEEWRIKGIIRKYSDYVTYPVEFVDKENKAERINRSTPVWAKNKKENTPEDYNELYKQIGYDFREPLAYEHLSVEGTTSFQSVVFVPSEPPFDFFQRDAAYGLHLYVKRVSIMEKCKELLPEYLRFVSGVVETDDLPLNVSREILQQNTKLSVIKKQIVKKVLAKLLDIQKNEKEKYISFFEKFGPVLKEGFHYDKESHETLSQLALFKTSKQDSWSTLDEYVSRFAEGQKEIYYITGASFEALKQNPLLESLTSKGIEVLLLADAIDEWFTMEYTEHKGNKLKNIAKGDIDISEVGKKTDAPEAKEPEAEDLAWLMQNFRDLLAQDIKDVKTSKRLTESPCCLVSEESGMSAHMERMMKASQKDFVGQKRILEINPSHPLVTTMLTFKDKNQDSLKEWVEVLYDTALIAEGSQIKNPGTFAKRLSKMLANSIHTNTAL
jgi:molecular chaperone HtpG